MLEFQAGTSMAVPVVAGSAAMVRAKVWRALSSVNQGVSDEAHCSCRLWPNTRGVFTFAAGV